MGLTERVALPAGLSEAVASTGADWGPDGLLGRLWLRDSAVWTGRDESQWLGWLDVPHGDGPIGQRLTTFVERLEQDGIRYAALLGMGGSSLFPDMLRQVFGHRRGVDLRVLDSTDPAQVRAFESTLDLGETVFIVSSKSGTTLETRLFYRYFSDRVKEQVGPELVASRFSAVTDPGSPLDRLASEQGFRAVFHGDAAIGGRFSALSYFGTVPAAVMGLDVADLLARGRAMAESCHPAVPVGENPGVQLGLILGLAARDGRDKVTLVTSPSLGGFGAWIEQLVAESTGKAGTALMPIDGERLGMPEVYRADRLFISIRLSDDTDAVQEAALDRLEDAGHPVVRFVLQSPYDLGAECFRWEFATAVAAAVLGVHPFDQPDVEAAKAATREVTSQYAVGQRARDHAPVVTSSYATGEVSAYAPGVYGKGLRRMLPAGATMTQWVAAHLAQLRPGDYFAILAYVEWCEPYRRILDGIRHRVRDVTGAATTVGFGPRFLHSTGQAHKGGPNNGVYLVVTCEDVVDVAVPDEPYSFGVVKSAQARGDEAVLAERKRRSLRLHLDGEVGEGLSTVASLVEAVVKVRRS